MKKDRLEEIKAMKAEAKEKIKGKKFDKLNAKEKDELLLTMARMLGLID
ncbi:MAG: hypothetical protein PHX74_10770 [Candidatus Sumerlaeales bacterium]|nr:hypothetical protein [Candidatus Sumerlaeales bacterium]